MGDAIGTTISTPPAGANPPVPEVKVERPAWLPEKFKTEADLVKSYSELERKLSKMSAPPATPPTTKTVVETTKTNEVPGVNAESTVITDEVTKTAAETVKAAGLDMQALEEEVASLGDLSPESRAKLEAAGIGAQQIDAYRRGVEAQRTDFETAVTKGLKGGKEALTEAIQWAAKEAESGTFSQKEVDAFNKAMVSSDPALAALAAEGLVSRFKRSQGPVLIDGVTPTDAAPGYASRAQQQADMKDPRYKTDPAFRRQVELKSFNSKAF
jgi:hypothetical protein